MNIAKYYEERNKEATSSPCITLADNYYKAEAWALVLEYLELAENKTSTTTRRREFRFSSRLFELMFQRQKRSGHKKPQGGRRQHSKTTRCSFEQGKLGLI